LSCGVVLLQQILRYPLEFLIRLNEECFPEQSTLSRDSSRKAVTWTARGFLFPSLPVSTL